MARSDVSSAICIVLPTMLTLSQVNVSARRDLATAARTSTANFKPKLLDFRISAVFHNGNYSGIVSIMLMLERPQSILTCNFTMQFIRLPFPERAGNQHRSRTVITAC
jgi:hypothetical protein